MAHCCQSGKAASGPYKHSGKFSSIGGLEVYETGAPNLGHDERELLLLLPDGFGLALHNVMLADKYAEAGWHVVVPDYFEGDPLPVGILSGDVHLSFDERASDDSNAQERQEILLPVWLKRHDHVHVSSLLAGLTTALKARHPEVDLFGVGYCFGGKHVLRLARSALVAAASFHPSMLVAEDLADVSVPVYAGLAELDEMVPETLEHDLRNWSKTMMEPVASFTLRVYSGMGHGFAARPNAQDEEIWKQYRMAFIDAVVFLDLHRRAKAI